jgi:hypothetical protein
MHVVLVRWYRHVHSAIMKLSLFNSTKVVDVSCLSQLSEPVLAKIVAEGEAMVAAQFQSHLSSEQRGLSVLGICLTAATALVGAYLTVDRIKLNGDLLASSSLWLAISLMISAAFSLGSVWPRKVHIPGNEPKNWLPQHWPAGVKRTLKQTRVEQCKVLQTQISENRQSAQLKARLQRTSIICGFLAVLVGGAYTAAHVQFVTMEVTATKETKVLKNANAGQERKSLRRRP